MEAPRELCTVEAPQTHEVCACCVEASSAWSGGGPDGANSLKSVDVRLRPVTSRASAEAARPARPQQGQCRSLRCEGNAAQVDAVHDEVLHHHDIRPGELYKPALDPERCLPPDQDFTLSTQSRNVLFPAK